MRHIQDCDVKHKVVLLRADLNVPIVKGIVQDKTRIEALRTTMQHLVSSGAKVALISHLGRPQSREGNYSLRQLVDEIKEVLSIKVQFVDDCIGEKVKVALADLQFGEVLLLENLRFYKEEEQNDQDFSQKMASIADLYVNDAFSCSHRNHASIVGVTKFLPSFAGLGLQDELKHLNRILSSDDKPSMAIVGGSKISTKLEVLLNLAKKVNCLVLGGAIANNFLLQQGISIGKSLVEKDMTALVKQVLAVAEDNNCRVMLPVDVVVARSINSNIGMVKDVDALNIQEMIFDIGPKTVDSINKAMSDAKVVLWNGPLGAFEHLPFANGTFSVAGALSALSKKGQVISVVGGGDSISAINAARICGFSYVSTAGGAFLWWLGGQKLPGIEALEDTSR